MVWIKSLATTARCSFCSGSRRCRMNFAMIHFMPRSCVKILNRVVFGIPRPTSSSRPVSGRSLFIATRTHSTFSGVLLVTGLPEHGSLSTDSQPSLKHSHFYLCCTHGIIPESLLSHTNSSHGGMFKLNAKFDADSLVYLFSHFECDSHTVHMLTQSHLSPLLTSTVKSSFITHEHSSPLSLAARLHWCHANYSPYINNGWTSPGQTSQLLSMQG